MTKTKGSESSLIESATGWDEAGDFALQFYNAKLLVGFGCVQAGDVVACAVVDHANSEFRIYDDNGDKIASHKMKLSLDFTE